MVVGSGGYWCLLLEGLSMVGAWCVTKPRVDVIVFWLHHSLPIPLSHYFRGLFSCVVLRYLPF